MLAQWSAVEALEHENGGLVFDSWMLLHECTLVRSSIPGRNYGSMLLVSNNVLTRINP